MISHDHQCIFVHIPKTGGTSIKDGIQAAGKALPTLTEEWMGRWPVFDQDGLKSW